MRRSRPTAPVEAKGRSRRRKTAIPVSRQGSNELRGTGRSVAQSSEAPKQPHERTAPDRRRPALTVVSDPHAHRQTHSPSPMYRSVVSRPNTSPPRSAGEPGRARHMRLRSPHPQSRIRPLSTASSPAIRCPPHRHAHDHTPAPRNCSATRSPNARPVTSRLGGNGQSGRRGEEIRFFTPPMYGFDTQLSSMIAFAPSW